MSVAEVVNKVPTWARYLTVGIGGLAIGGAIGIAVGRNIEKKKLSETEEKKEKKAESK